MARLIVLLAVICLFACSAHARRNSRLVDGTEVDIRAAPFMAQIKYRLPSGNYTTGCGGTIVDPIHIVSSAHCFMKDKVEDILVEVGSTFREQEGGRRYAVKSVVGHAKFQNKKFLTWKPLNQRYDVAVVTLAEPLTFDDYVQPIGQIAATRVLNRERLLTGGWGTIKEPTRLTTEFGNSLKIARVEKWGDADCKKYLYNVIFTNVVNEATDWMICALPIDGTVCNGDSGSPLWLPKSATNPSDRFVGIVQGAQHCDPKKDVPVFVDLADPAIREFLAANGVKVPPVPTKP